MKRRSEAGVDQVRVMTVHGAKGLEAPIVILPDTAVRQDGAQPAADGPPRRRPGRPGRSAPSSPRRRFAAAEDAPPRLVREESRRLLYVALTRARALAHRLRRRHPAAERRELARPRRRGDGRGSVPRPSPAPTATSSRSHHNWTAAPAGPPPRPPPADPPLPDWTRRPARRPAAAATRRSRPPASAALTSSPASADRPSSPRPRPRPAARPSTACSSTCTAAPPPSAPALAARLLPDTPDLPALLAEAAAVLDAPELAFLFGPDSLAEVDVAAPLAELGGRASSAASTG